MSGIRNTDYQIKNPPPPSYLSKETLIIWESWSKMGNKEVARESAAKGSHTDLATTFLSQRKRLSLAQAEQWFNNEIRSWASELLSNKQVFRASHILTNIKLDPINEIQKIFSDTVNKELRDYLASHLTKAGSLDGDLRQSYELLKLIEDCGDVPSVAVDAPEMNVKFISTKDNEWKSQIAAQLFLSSLNFDLTSFLQPSHLWQSALKTKKHDFLTVWLNVQFSKDYSGTETNTDLLEFLQKSEIDTTMLSYLYHNTEISDDVRFTICDNLAEYGIFAPEEENDLCKIISRISNGKQMHNLESILSSKSGNISKEKLQSLIFNYCLDKGLYIVMDICTKNYTLPDKDDANVELINSHRDFVKAINDEEKMINNLLQLMRYFGNVEDKYMDSIVKLFVLFLKKEDLFTVLCDLKNTQFEALKVLNIIFGKAMRIGEVFKMNLYVLLSKHLKVIPENLFPYRFSDEYEIPHFNLNSFVEKYGYKKRISYKFYLMQSRPSKACFTANKEGGFIKEKVVRLAVKNFFKKNVTSSCISFLEMIGESSENLRIDSKVIDLIWSSGIYRKEEDVINLILQKADSVVPILNEVESAIYSQLDLNANYADVIDAFKTLDVFYKYAENHELHLPDALLQKFAENDQWLLFFIVIQKYSYPQEQLIKLVQNFKDQRLLEHIYHCLVHDVQYEHKNTIMRERDSRNYFLSRIGVRKNRDDPMTTSMTSQSSYGSNSSSGLSDYSDVEMPDLNSVDLLQVLIKCHNSGDPPKALLHACVHYKYPLFAILATCYEPDSVITNWLTWLAVTCNMAQAESYEFMALVGNDVIDFMESILERGYYKTLKQSFHIFLSDNPLNVFMSMLSDCISFNYKIDALQEKLEKFHDTLKSCCGNNLTTEVDVELTYLNNKIWIENAALVLLASTLQHCFKTVFNKIQFLTIINELDLQTYFFTKLPNFGNVNEILTYLFKARISVNIDFFKMCKVCSYKEEVAACINKLVNMNMFEEALKVADIAESAADVILAKKWKQIFTQNGVGEFIEDCDSQFRELKMIPKNAVLFYSQFSVDDPHDKYKLLAVAYRWASENNLEEELGLEFGMWKSYLKLNDSYQHEIKYKNKNLKLYSEMKIELEKFNADESSVNLDTHEINRLDLLINQLLGSGDVFQAFKLEKMFGHTNSNLDILRLCFNLAEGLTLPFQLNAQERLLLRKRSNFRTFSHRMKSLRPARLSSLSSVSRSPGTISVNTVMEVETVVEDTLTLIENLIDGLSSGFEIGQNILMVYRISINIDKKYSNIVENADPEPLLLEALESNCKNKLEVVHDFITVYKWPKQKIAHFLCEQIIFMIVYTTEKKENSSELWDINLNTDIHLILQLLPDTSSILGTALYTYASALHKSQTVSIEYPNSNEITHVVELLIRAHDCYTADCNMEGISVILKKCQTLINLLLTLKNWYLIVRLLTGVARYNELNYVFHILRENDQFEYLLRRGKSNVRDNGLKVALLEYLKRYCPDNRELYKMVALHFSLYSEVAQLWENESASIVRNLIAISELEMQNRKINTDACLLVELTNTDGTRLCLNKAMENYTHASEYHLEGDKLAKAMNAARQAELVALQMSLLKGLSSSGTATCILNLNSTQINVLVLKGLSFPQALILTEAYEHPIDWANIIFEQYIMNNHVNYLANFLSVFTLSDGLVYDISRRFLNGNINTDSAIHNMKSILRMLPSVNTKYRVASELGFLDIVEDLLNTNKLMYLKDTVWKKGYKN